MDPSSLAEQIAQLEAALTQPLPDSVRAPLQQELARLRALQSGMHGTVTNTGTLHGNAIGVNLGTVQTYFGSTPPSTKPAGQPARSATPEQIEGQQRLLASHRRTLGVLLEQLAQLSSMHAPPGVANGIAEARAGIRRAKVALRGWGVEVEDLPGDEEDEG